VSMTSPSHSVPFVKGHGTGNDFVIIPDPEAALDLTPEQVKAVCDRRFGIGGDGVLRAVPTSSVAEVADQAGDAEWFMDYRNADGSIAEMCGNGARVFARYLVESGLNEPGLLHFATRSGVLRAEVPVAGDVAVSMGVATRDPGGELEVSISDRSWPGIGVHAPNPHVIVEVADVAEAGSLLTAPAIAPESSVPDGANVEFVQVLAPGHVRMRVHERGAGETLSCGTGACAVAWAHAGQYGTSLLSGVRVDVPGGTVRIHESESGSLVLIGPAILVAHGTLDVAWWDQHDSR
jgi:diaminopimelate epimerase